MKHLNNSLLYFISIILIILFNACSDSTAPTISNESNPLKGAYILYYSPSTGTDYAYYDAVKDSVTDFIFTANNPGKRLGVNPGEMKLNSDRKLYVTTLGIPNSNGTIYKIDPESNSIIDSLRFGVNPFGFAINNNRIVVANSGSNTVSVLDLDFNIIRDTIVTGSYTRKVLYGYNRYIVSRHSTSSEHTLAMIEESSYMVSRITYPGVPLSAIYNVNGIFTSLDNSKNVYWINPETNTTIDSFAVPTIFQNVSELIFKTQNSFFAVAGGREVWLANVSGGTFTFSNIYPAALNESIMKASYEANSNELYLGVTDNSSGNNFLFIIDGTNGIVKRTKPLAGSNLASIVFRYF